MIEFYKNKKQNFECSVKITGTNPDSAKARLILVSDDYSKRIFVEGKIKDHKCLIEIYPNINIKPRGKAMLEVIVDESVIFAPWESAYELLSEEIHVESTHVSKSSSSGVTVKLLDDAKIAHKPVVVKPSVKLDPVIEKKIVEKKVDNSINMDTLYKALLENMNDDKKKPLKEQIIWEVNKIINNSSDKNKNVLKLYKQSITNLDENTLRELIKFVKSDYKPTMESIKLAKSMKLKDSNIVNRFLMYLSEIKK